jgi:hypothetical protein
LRARLATARDHGREREKSDSVHPAR